MGRIKKKHFYFNDISTPTIDKKTGKITKLYYCIYSPTTSGMNINNASIHLNPTQKMKFCQGCYDTLRPNNNITKSFTNSTYHCEVKQPEGQQLDGQQHIGRQQLEVKRLNNNLFLLSTMLITFFLVSIFWF